MCGIIAFNWDQERLGVAATNTIRHRGPDDSGVRVAGGVTLGNRRLAILDLSPAGHMPMETVDGTLAITYNGEIYNCGDLRSELIREGVEFRGRSDTEVILEGYRRWGASVFDRLRGMWALVIHDAARGRLVMSRDPFGIKPLFVWQDGAHIAVGSEIKALRAVLADRGARLGLSPVGVAAYTVLGYVPHPDTVYEHVRKVAPGSVIEVVAATGSVVDERRILLPAAESPVVDPIGGFAATLKGSVAAHLLSDVPVGVFLSGGADSTTIALAVQELGHRMRAFTVDIPGRTDAAYAGRIAAHAGLDHLVVPFDGPAFDRAWSRCWGLLDEPIADTSLLPSLAVAEAAAEHVKVVLTGEGGDELFLGYPRYGLLHGLARIHRPDRVMRFLGSIGSDAEWYLRWGRPLLRRIRLGYARHIRRDAWATYLESAAVDLGTQSHLPLLERGAREFEGAEGDIAAFDREWYLSDDLLYKTDFATMAHSIEGRVPFLDRTVFAFARSLPEAWTWGGVGKRVIKEFLLQRLPSTVVMRDKAGFSVPLAPHLARHAAEIRDAYATVRDMLTSVGLPCGVQARCADDASFRERWVARFRHFTFLTVVLAKTAGRHAEF